VQSAIRAGRRTLPPAPGGGSYSNADALLDVARVFLDTAPEDRSGEDRTLVVVHVSAENLSRNLSGVPAGTSPQPAERSDTTPESMQMPAEPVEASPSAPNPAENVPAGTSQPSQAACHIVGVGSVGAATAQKHACDSSLLGAVVDRHGKVLALGRTRRLVSKALRRALMIRDRMCCYPGCHQTRHLKAHHVVPWILGGRTDLDNLILLCQWHHTAVHEGGITITREGQGWVFRKPDGRCCERWVDDQNLARHLDFALRRRQQTHDRLAAVDSFQHPDAQTIRPRWAGEPFDLHACVQALFTIKLLEPTADLDQQAA
jgi:HNH endonuclease